MDGKVKAIEVDCSSTVSEVFNTVVEKIGLKESDQFAIYETVDYMERSLREAELIGDVLAKWEKNYTNVKILKIVFKKKVFLVPQEDSRDPVAKDLIFHQAVYDVISGKIPVTEQDALKLAGYQMQCFWGDFDPSKNFAKQLTSELSMYIPAPLLNIHTAEQWQAKLAEIHPELRGLSAEVAKEMYIKHIKKHLLYGSSFFTVKGFGEMSGQNISLAINWKGIHIIDRDSKVNDSKCSRTYT